MEPSHSHRGSCAACGTSPVNHSFTFIMSMVEGTIEPLGKFFMGWMPISKNGRAANAVAGSMLGFFRVIGLAKLNSDPELAVTGRARLIWDEAIRRGIPMQQMVVAGKPLEQYRAKVNGRWIYFESLPIPPALPQSAYDWLDDKLTLKKKLKHAGIAVPGVYKINSWPAARRAFKKLEKPVIIKPRNGSRGRHTTTNIHTLEELKKAYDLAREITPFIVMEEHLDGSVCRATVIGGKLAGFFRADQPFVTGDGKHAVSELIEAANASKNERLGDIEINDDLRSFIEREGFTLESTVPESRQLKLSAKTGRLYGGYTREMLPDVHPKLREVFDRITETVPAPVLGFDLILENPDRDPDTQKWGIIECNSLPFIDLHYYAFEGPALDLSKNVWDLWGMQK